MDREMAWEVRKQLQTTVIQVVSVAACTLNHGSCGTTRPYNLDAGQREETYVAIRPGLITCVAHTGAMWSSVRLDPLIEELLED